MTPLAAPLLAVALAASGGPARVALLVANDTGDADERPLRHTGADAERLAAVLVELGGFAPGDVHVVKNRTAAEILDAVDGLARGPQAAMFVFYYSGHADAAALHAAGTLLPLDLLLHRLRAVPADLRVGVLDACQSGAATRAKGSRPAAPFAVQLDDQASAGDILISSSADDEQSFETERGGVFTLQLTGGLRGAADENGDGQVTLSEAYAYAYAQTLRSTLAASTGPQHARFRFDLSGRRDPVLTQLARGALLTLQPRTAGEYVVFDGKERSVVAELPARPGESRRIALAPGGYVVQQRGVASLRAARIALAAGDDRVLHEHQMQEVPLLRLARKGAPGERRIAVSGGQYASGLGPRGPFLGAVGVEWEGPVWLLGVDVAGSSGDERHRGLTTRDDLLQVSAEVLWSIRTGAATLRAGPVAGLGVVRQVEPGHAARLGSVPSAGLRLRADADLNPNLGLFLQLDGRVLLAEVEGMPMPGGGHLTETRDFRWGAWSAGVRAAF